jgi:hypothetical protein
VSGYAEDHARAAVTSFVTRSLVLLVFTRQGERTPYHGSGSLVLARSGRVAVLTAAHVVRPGDFVSVVTQAEFIEDAVDEVIHAQGLDIAIAFVRDTISSRVRELAISMERIETSDERRLAKGSQLVAAGFPEQFTYDARHPEHGWLQHRFADILHYTSEFDHDDQAISIAWKQGQITGNSFPFDDLGVPRDQTVQFKKPSGLSGGPVYHVRSPRKGLLWSPTSDATLIGIAAEFTNRRELAIPWWRWST